MKKILLFSLLLLSVFSFAQKDYSRYYNAWRLGLNVGGAWQTADYRSCWGMAGGFTLEKGFHENADNIFSFAVRARYLAANTYGMDYNRNYSVQGNDAYNGKYDPAVNYADSFPLGQRYVFDNYKTTLYEGSIELQVSFNRLRERTHVILNLWGGIGITSYRAKSDLLDGDKKMYNFSQIDSTGNKTKALSTYNSLINKSYESYAYGSRNGNLITFSPSLGIGLGYQFSPVFSMLLEYKLTLPQGTNADLLDGKFGNNRDFIGGNNDYYHYTGINLLFTLRGKKKTTPTEEPTHTDAYVPATNTVVATTPSVTTQPTTNSVVVTQPTEPKPVISFITPPVNGHITNSQQYKISAQVLNVTNANQLLFKQNGTVYTGFNFNAQTHILEFEAMLNQGSNLIQIDAANNAGSATAITSVVYELPKAAGNPPVVTFVKPATCPVNSQTRKYTVTTTVANVVDKNAITVKFNNTPVTNYYFNTTNGQITLPVNLVNGPNTIALSAVNAFGSDAKSCTIHYVEPLQQTLPPPVISFIDPVQPGTVVNVANYAVKAQILNISGQNQASVYVNGLSVPLTYNAATKQILFTTALLTGTNHISVTANNPYGEDTKVTEIIYQENKPAGLPPVIGLLNPVSVTATVANTLYSFKFSVLNVIAQNNMIVEFNGALVSNFTYNTASKELLFPATLIAGANQVVVKAINSYGSDTKTVTVTYQQPGKLKLPPVVTITNPAIPNAVSLSSNYAFKATVKNVTAASGIVVKLNNAVVTNYTFDGLTIDYAANLNPGNNVFEVSATNTEGTDIKSATVNYKQKTISLPPPVVNLINPGYATNAANVPNYIFKLSVLNVVSAADIQVTFNGSPQTNFTYNATTKELDYSTTLMPGNNSLLVKGINQSGSDFKLISVTYTPPEIPKTPPHITFINPSSGTAISQASNYNFKATITNMPVNNGIAVKFNGSTISNYSYDGFNLMYNATLISGNNTLEITAANTDGNDTKTAYVTYKPKVLVVAPVVSIIQPVGNPTVNNAGYLFQFKALNVNQNQVEVFFNGTAVPAFNFNNSLGDFNGTLVSGTNTLLVKATNQAGTDSKTETIIFKDPAKTKVKMCVDQDGDGVRETIEVNAEDVNTYLNNGATRGACSPRGVGNADTNGTRSTMVICVCENGDTLNPVTKTILKTQWPAYQSQGAKQGACPEKSNTTPGKTGDTKPVVRPNVVRPVRGKPATNSNDTIPKK